jgi:hypothetical protein
MELREGDSWLEVVRLETSSPGTPAAGDVRLRVRVCSGGFAGESDLVWADAPSVARFLAQLRALDARRQGMARLEAIGSPDEFWLELRSLDRAGHLGVFGRFMRWQFLSSGEGHAQAVEFGFEFCPSRLPNVLAGFQQLESSDT